MATLPSPLLLAQAARTTPAVKPPAEPKFQHTGGWLGFRGQGGDALQVKLGRSATGQAQVQTAGGRTYVVPPGLTDRNAIAQWLHKADAARAITGAWANPGAARTADSFQPNHAQTVARERLSGTWDVKVSGIKAGMTYARAAVEFDKRNGMLKLYVQPPSGELQLFEIDMGATVYNQAGALTSNGVAGATHEFFRLQKEHPVLAMVAWAVMGTLGAAATKNPGMARHVGIAAGSLAVAGQADEVRVSLVQTKVSAVVQGRVNLAEAALAGSRGKRTHGEARAGVTAEGSLGRVGASFNTQALGPLGGVLFGEPAKALEYRGGAFVGKLELHAKFTTERGHITVKPEVKAQEFVSLAGRNGTGWRVVIGADGRAIDLSTNEGKAAAARQFAGLSTPLRLQAVDPADRSGGSNGRNSLVTAVVPRLYVNQGQAGRTQDPTIYQSRSPSSNAVSRLLIGRDAARGGLVLNYGWQKSWNDFNRAMGAPFENRLVPLDVIAGNLKAMGTRDPARYGELAYVNEKRLLQANGERLYWVQTGLDAAGKPIRVPCLREGDVYNTTLVTIEGRPGLHLASAQQTNGSRVASPLSKAAPTTAWPGPAPAGVTRKSVSAFAAYQVAESYRQRLLAMQSNTGLSPAQLGRIDGQIQTLTQRLAQARSRLVPASNGLLRVEAGGRLVASPRLTTAIQSWPREAARQDAYTQYLTTL
ncbi:MAG: hypothetical protein LH480_15115 [Rubrivivax sp.]|nr:hypothetical protein [Rubrivivax sp.]